MAILAAEAVRRFGIEPRVAFVSHSNFGSSDHPSAEKMRVACALAKRHAPELEVDGEMHGDTALSTTIRGIAFPDSTLTQNANLLVMPDLDSANIAFNLVKQLSEGMSVGPILIGMAGSAHVVTPAITVRGLVNMTAVAVVNAQDHAADAAQPAPLVDRTVAGE